MLVPFIFMYLCIHIYIYIFFWGGMAYLHCLNLIYQWKMDPLNMNILPLFTFSIHCNAMLNGRAPGENIRHTKGKGEGRS